MPVALPLRVTVQLGLRADAEIRATTDAQVEPTWIRYVHGAARVLELDRGLEVHVSGDLPPGAGLGSSGALGVALLRAMREAFGRDLDDVAVAKLAQRIENQDVGVPSGIMDQMAASIGREGEALFLDCRTLEFQRIPLPAKCELVVIDSGVKHQHSAGAYNERRRECEDAARALGIPELRDAGAADRKRIQALPDPLRKRARHVVSENARVLAAANWALRDPDLGRMGELLDGSHRSLRDDFEVSTPEVDLLVELVREEPGIHGARITGGGWGGSIVALADAGAGRAAAAAAVAEYEQRTGLDARILLPVPDRVADS